MGKKNIYLNNVPVPKAFLVETSENLIVVKSIKEEFLGVSTINIGGDDIICEHVENNIVKCSVRIGDDVYEDIPFNLVVDRKAKPQVAINIHTLKDPSLFVEKEEDIPDLEVIEESIPKREIEEKLLQETKQQLQEKAITINKLEREIENLHELSKQRQKIEEETLNEFVQTNIEKGIEDYKQKLLKDFFTIIDEQEKIKLSFLGEAINDLDKKHIESINEIKETTSTKLDNDVTLLYEKLETYKQTLKRDIREILEHRDSYIKLTLQRNFDEKLVKAKAGLINEYIKDIEKSNSEIRKDINKQFIFLQQKLDKKVVEPISFDSSQLVVEAVKMFLTEDKKAKGKLKKVRDSFISELKKAAAQYTNDANKRMMRYAEMMAGGGSAGNGFAFGGTMQGDLNVTGNILSGSNNLSNFFTTGEYVHGNFLPLSGGTITGSLYVNNNLYVAGSALFVSTEDLIIKDPIIYLAEGNKTDLFDTGFMSSWTNPPGYPTGYQHGGLVRRSDNKTWTFFSGATAEPLSGRNVEWNQQGVTLDPLSAKFYGDIYGKRTLFGNLKITDSLTVVGLVSTNEIVATNDITADRIQATVKNFRIKHPTKPDKHLIYSSLETPYNGIQITGKGVIKDGKCVISLPEYLKDLIHTKNVHIQLTNYKHSKQLYIDSIEVDKNRFIVKCDTWGKKANNIEFFWLLNGVRKDIEELQVEV